MTNDHAPLACNDLVTEYAVSRLYDLGLLDSILAAHAFSVADEAELYIGIIHNSSSSDADRMRAVRELRNLTNDLLEKAGLLTEDNLTVTTTDGERSIMAKRSVKRLSEGLARLQTELPDVHRPHFIPPTPKTKEPEADADTEKDTAGPVASAEQTPDPQPDHDRDARRDQGGDGIDPSPLGDPLSD